MSVWTWFENHMSALIQAETDDAKVNFLYQFYDLPTYVVESNGPIVEALVPELLTYAQGEKDKWLEVFVRHWHLQYRAYNLGLGADALKDAIHLIELTSQEEVKSCPQAFCAVQDLSFCYQNTDYLAFSEARTQIARETLDRLTPNEECYRCILAEYVGSLQVEQGPEAALAAHLEYGQRYVEMGGPPADFADKDQGFFLTKAQLYPLLGRSQEVVDVLEANPDWYMDREDRHSVLHRMALSNAYLETGKVEKAAELRPTLEDSQIRIATSIVDWLELTYKLLDGQHVPSSIIQTELLVILENLIALKNGRVAIELSLRLMTQYDEHLSDTERAMVLDLAQKAIPFLAEDLGAAVALEEAKQKTMNKG